MSKSRQLANTSTLGVSNTLVATYDANTTSTGFFQVPVGTTAQRPTPITKGYIRYNTDLNVLESANGSAWANVGSGSASSSGGGISWQPVQTSNFVAVAGNGYGVNTATNAIVVTLPTSPTVGQQINLFDYGQTFSANALTIYANGNKILGNTANITMQSSGASVGLVYYDTTKGWIPYNGFPSAIVGPYTLSYLIVAGGGGGGVQVGGGGGAGGMITGTSITVNPGTSYTFSIGAGAAGSTTSSSYGGSGGNSTGFGLTAIGGGGGGSHQNNGVSTSGGSGGGGGGGVSGGVSGSSGTAGQGNPGGNGLTGSWSGGGGGGAGASGANGSPDVGGNGGAGVYWNANYYAGGGGGCSSSSTLSSGGSGVGGGGWSTGNTNNTLNGMTNRGGGGGGVRDTYNGGYAGNGGSGVVVISYFGMQRGSGGTVTSTGGYTYHTFTSSGTFIA